MVYVLAIVSFVSTVKAEETFYLGDHVPDIYIYMNRINKKVYRQFRMIYSSKTGELVYCVEPGSTLSSGVYTESFNFNQDFNISVDKWDKLKKIAYYGYKYKDHTDIKWYAITQYVIWKEVMPSNWELYFVDANHNRMDNLFIDEINELYSLVNNNPSKPNLLNEYVFNLYDDYNIVDSNNLIGSYNSNKGNIINNYIDLSNVLSVGRNDVNLVFNNYKKSLYYYNSGGQNILSRGDIFPDNINFSVYVTSGKLHINECGENDESEFIGGTYEVLDQDDQVVDEIICIKEKECTSKNLPVGHLNVRIKILSDLYQKNEHIYDAIIKDGEVTDIDICSYKKKALKKELISDDHSDIKEQHDIEIANESEYEIINVPFTYKSSLLRNIFIFGIIIICMCLNRYVKRNN